MLGSDVLYPEVGRLLAYQGADLVVTLGACADLTLYNKVRSGILARMQDNQLFAVASFLVGHNQLSRVRRQPYVGKSAILAPQELTPRSNGVLVEMANLRSEGVLTAEWDFLALRRLWESSDTPVRQKLPLAQAGQALAQLYARLQSLPQAGSHRLLDAPPAVRPDGDQSTQPLLTLDELSVVSSVTSRWPPVSALRVQDADDFDDAPFIVEAVELQAEAGASDEETRSEDTTTNVQPGVRPSQFPNAEKEPPPMTDSAGPGLAPHIAKPGGKGTDDETDEMDALPESPQEDTQE